MAEFLDSAQQSGLLSVDEAATLSRELHESGAATKHDVAARLVEKKLLTPFQAEQLLSGRGGECVLAGRYFIRQKLGAGAMGAVYLADDKKLERAVAIKVLPAQSVTDAGAVARFQREAKALAKLSHPNIVQAYDSDEDAGRQFLVMEYAEGMNLRDLLRAKGRIAPAQAADYIYQAALGLQNAHEKGLVHRDLKPGNLLLASNGQLKILDLGLARFLQDHVGDATLTREGTGMGTPDYMPPEQFHDARHVDARSDIYSLGCTLYHLLAGRVPFPGTSMTEKYAAHEQQAPPPLEEVCPDVPAGLALAVQRMMARRPADRFQSAREVAEALFPHVAGSSNSIMQIKATASWHGSQLGLSVVPLRVRRRRRLAIRSAVAAAAVAVVALSLWASGTFGPRSPKLQPTIPGDPNVLTVAKHGSGEFRTIAEALAKVDHPDMTIRVVDSEVYEESIEIRDRDRHAGLTIESPHQAKLTIPKDSRGAVTILNVPRVKIRGFVVEVRRSRTGGVFLIGYCAGTAFEGLEFRGSQTWTTGISLESAFVDDGDAPIVIQDCKFDGVANGIEVLGQNLTTNQAAPLRGLVVQDNVFRGNIVAIWMIGRLNRVLIVSNRVQNFSETGILLAGLTEGSGQLLMANNTLRGLRNCIQITGLQQTVASVEIVNNLIAAERGLDIASLGTAPEVIRPWNVSHNLRYSRKPDDADPSGAIWIEPDDDTILDKVEWSSADVASSDYLVPQDLSALTSAGAGGDLPTYVGAVPSEGVAAWDWRKTWDARHPKMLLTVSKDPKDKGEFRTIGEALKAARPKVTIRVLDAATYAESFTIDDPAKHEGITLEAPKHAEIVLPSTAEVLAIRNVSGVRFKGFRILEREPKTGQLQGLLVVSGHTPGVVLEGLEVQTKGDSSAIALTVRNLASDEPLMVQNNSLRGGVGIYVNGSKGVCLRSNSITDCSQGIRIEGEVAQAHVSGNLIGNCRNSAVEIQELNAQSKGILLANNTLYSSQILIRIWDYEPFEDYGLGQMELRNNLLFGAELTDILLVHGSMGKNEPADSKHLAALWDFKCNWRDLAGTNPGNATPLGEHDRKLETVKFVTREPSSADFLRPLPDSPLAREGAGKEDPSLPTYVGAVPPHGVEPWDWDKTWLSRRHSPSEDSKQ